MAPIPFNLPIETVVSELGPAPVEGHRLVLVHFEDKEFTKWIKLISGRGFHQCSIANRKGQPVIMTIPKDISAKALVEDMRRPSSLMAVLVASRGEEQRDPYKRCKRKDGKPPFERCIIVKGLVGHGCASCIYHRQEQREEDSSYSA